VDPVAHDRLVALTSHLPHALANLLVNQAGANRVDGHEPLAAAGGSLRDMTRVAGANPRIWVDIFVDNAGPVPEALAEHRKQLDRLEQALADGDAGFLAKWIGEAAGNRQRMLVDAYPDPGALQQLRIHIPDRPGVLAGITQALGAERINIEDFELLHMSPERGGTLTVLVTGENEARRGGPARGAGLRRRGHARSVRTVRVEPAAALVGDIAVPAVKGICQRGALLAAIADGESELRGFGHAADTDSALDAVRELGAE